MTRPLFSPWALSFAAVIGIAPAGAEESSESAVLVLFEKVGMSGRRISFDGPVADIDVRYPLHSASVQSGRWTLCTGNDFRGQCIELGPGETVESLKKELGFFSRVQSARPVPSPRAEADGGAPPPAPKTAGAASSLAKTDATSVVSANAALRGHASGYFTDPTLSGAAIDAGDGEAMTAFCRKAGFSEVRFAAPAAKGEGAVIGDLLCAGPADNNQFNDQ